MKMQHTNLNHNARSEIWKATNVRDIIWSHANLRSFPCVALPTSSPGRSPRSKWRSEKPLDKRLPKWLQKFVRISSRKHDEMSSFCLNNGFRLQKNKQGRQTLETTSEKAILSCVTWQNTPWFVEYWFLKVSSDRHFERGEGPGDEVVALHILTAQDLLRHLRMLWARVRPGSNRFPMRLSSPEKRIVISS